jgi:omega-amidase
LTRVRALCTAAASNGATCIVLPEFAFHPYDMSSVPSLAEPAAPGFPVFDTLSDIARSLQVTLVGGSLPERIPGPSGSPAFRNTTLVFGPSGTLVARYSKQHLFDISSPQLTFRESDVLTAGTELATFDAGAGFLAGLGVCFDVRFPAHATRYVAEHGANLLVYPAAFNHLTGPMHWHLLARARALDTQCYVLLCSPALAEAACEPGYNGYRAYGHTLLVAPNGNIVAELDHDGEGVLYATLTLSDVAEARAMLPVAAHLRAGGSKSPIAQPI